MLVSGDVGLEICYPVSMAYRAAPSTGNQPISSNPSSSSAKGSSSSSSSPSCPHVDRQRVQQGGRGAGRRCGSHPRIVGQFGVQHQRVAVRVAVAARLLDHAVLFAEDVREIFILLVFSVSLDLQLRPSSPHGRVISLVHGVGWVSNASACSCVAVRPRQALQIGRMKQAW